MKRLRIWCVLLAALMVFSVCGCEKNEPSPTVPPEDPPTIGEPTQQEPTVPTQTEEDYSVFDGVYRDLVSEQEGETGYVEITGYKDFILLEHFLCMEGSVYSFWAEEFWPSEGYYPNGTMPSVYGKSQTFSLMTTGEHYDDAPTNRSITLTEEGVVLNYDDSDAEYYIRDGSFRAHSSVEQMKERFAEDTVFDFETLYGSDALLGLWEFWDGWTAAQVRFEEDGAFSMFLKSPKEPIEVYRGAFGFGAYSGNLEICAEKVGSGEYPYAFNWQWQLSDGNILSVWDDEGTVLPSGLQHYFRAAEEAAHIEMEQQDALSYLWNSYELVGDYTDQYEHLYFYDYCLPQFYGDSDAVAEKNSIITETFAPIIEMELRAMEEGEILSFDSVNWESEIFEGVLYLQIYATTYDWEERAAFYLDVQTGEFLSTEQVLDRLLIDPSYFLQAVREGAEAAFVDQNAHIPMQEREQYGYYRTLEWTLSDEAVNLDLPVFVDRFGSIAVYAKIGSMAGADYIWQVLRPFDGAVG